MEEIMLVLSRKPGEKIVINNNITITVVGVIGNRVKIGIEAPDQVSILRGELIVDAEVTEFRDQWNEEAPAEPTTKAESPSRILSRPLLEARVCDSYRRLRQLPR
jgi:carbon storage regulator CsrA